MWSLTVCYDFWGWHTDCNLFLFLEFVMVFGVSTGESFYHPFVNYIMSGCFMFDVGLSLVMYTILLLCFIVSHLL